MTSAACRAVMMAVRERAVKVMAALERRVPSLDEFVGQSWTAWAEWAGVTATDGPDISDCSKNGKKTAEAMSLSKDDMSIFGLYPGHDDFYLVVCSHCGQVVKPQAFEKHCERRHGPLAKLYPRVRSPAQAGPLQPRSHKSHSPSHGTNTASSPAWEGRGPAVRPPWVAPSSPTAPSQYRHLKNPKDGVRHSSLDKSSHGGHMEALVFKQPPPQEPPISSPPPSLRDPPPPHDGTPPGRPSPGDRPPSQRKDSPLTSPVCSPRVPRPYNKVASKRECDLDKHCGVLDHERKKVCTRLLTCNIHSIHQRRKVVGRTKNFDLLVAELKTKVREKGAQLVEGGSGAGRSPSPETHREHCEAPHCRRPLASLPAFCRSSGASESPGEVEQQPQDERHVRASSPMVLGSISSDESETEAPEEHVEFSSSATHPRPFAMCSFGSRVLGQGVYTFDRRLHHLRSTLSSMLEQHISSLLWKKIPQATDMKSCHASVRTPLSSSSTPAMPPFNSKVHAGSLLCSSFKSFQEVSLSSRGPGRPAPAPQSENSWSGGTSPGPVQASQGKPDVHCPLGPRHRKQLGKLREEAGAAAVRKRKAPSQDEDAGPERNCAPAQDRGLPRCATPPSLKAPIHSLLPHGQTNGTHSPGSKPRPQPAPSEAHPPAAKGLWTYKRTHSSSTDSATNNSHGRGIIGDSGPHAAGAGRAAEHQGLLKKRRGGGLEEHAPSLKPPTQGPPPSSMLASASPRPNFYPWKESKTAGLAGGAEKKLGSQKVGAVGGLPARGLSRSKIVRDCTIESAFCPSLWAPAGLGPGLTAERLGGQGGQMKMKYLKLIR
ncbi:ataxin-7-like protein 2a [Neosynchiropus ocellatus]